MKRTSLVLPDTLHQQMVIISEQENISISELVRKLLQREFKRMQDQRLDSLYGVIHKLDGLSQKGPKNLSQDVDEVLYGENGTWRGKDV